MKKLFGLLLLSAFILIVALSSCNNPFAPALDGSSSIDGVLSDQKTVDGLFKNFAYAYNFRDTLVYGNILDNDFTFIYQNEDGYTASWNREVDMITTYRLFSSVQRMDLIWSDIYSQSGDSLQQEITRGLTLTIVFSSTDIASIGGRATFRLVRKSEKDDWMIAQWRDESKY